MLVPEYEIVETANCLFQADMRIPEDNSNGMIKNIFLDSMCDCDLVHQLSVVHQLFLCEDVEITELGGHGLSPCEWGYVSMYIGT